MIRCALFSRSEVNDFNLGVPRSPNFQFFRFPDAATGQTLSSQPAPCPLSQTHPGITCVARSPCYNLDLSLPNNPKRWIMTLPRLPQSASNSPATGGQAVHKVKLSIATYKKRYAGPQLSALQELLGSGFTGGHFERTDHA